MGSMCLMPFHLLHSRDYYEPSSPQPNSLKWHWRPIMVGKWTINFLATALVDIPAVSMPIARCLKTWDICDIVWQNCTRCTCVMIMLFNQIIDMPHRSGGWIILAKGKCSLTGMCVWKISGLFYFSSWDIGSTLNMLRFYFCSVYLSLLCYCCQYSIPFLCTVISMLLHV